MAAVAALVAVSGAAAAQPYPPVEDRHYTLDLYTGSVVGSVRVIGMGGASVAGAVGSVGTLSNVAAPAVRRTTKSGTWAWDFHVDAQSAAFASDFDNNGMPDTDESSSKVGTVGIVVQAGPWGLGLVATTASTQIADRDAPGAGVLDAQASVGKLVLARSFAAEAHTVGAGLRVGSLAMVRPRPGLDEVTLFTVSSPNLEAGWVWRPARRSLRVGVDGSLPVSTRSVTVEGCDPLDCDGYILPERVTVPWTMAAGVAYRAGATPWNQRIAAQYRDELALVLAADLVVTGAVRDGHGVEAFARHQLQPSGTRPVVMARGGGEVELVPGWVRVRAGTYWEPSRFEGVDGRLHGTAGADLRLFGFHLFGSAFRVQVSAHIDAAARYGNGGVSVGFWQ